MIASISAQPSGHPPGARAPTGRRRRQRGTSQQTVSRVERGRSDPFRRTLWSRGEAIERTDDRLRWRDPTGRLLDRSTLSCRSGRAPAFGRWLEVHVEESFNCFGERGSVDILAWRLDCRPSSRRDQTELVDLQDTVRTLDMKAGSFTRGPVGACWRPRLSPPFSCFRCERPPRRCGPACRAICRGMRAQPRVQRWMRSRLGPARVWFLPNSIG